MPVTLLLLDEEPTENAVRIEYFKHEETVVYYKVVPKYIHRHGDYYERTEEESPSYSWDRWLKEGEQHFTEPDEPHWNESGISRWEKYHRDFRCWGWAVTFDTVEEMLEYLVSVQPVFFETGYRMLDGTPLIGIETYCNDW